MRTYQIRGFVPVAIGLIVALFFGPAPAMAQSYFQVDVKGKGKPMILIHGLYCSGDVWKDVVEKYQQQYECHIITLSGFGGQAPNLNGNFLESVKNDILSYIKNKNLKKPILVGHSMGGFISFWAAASAPGLFSAVVAVDGVPYLTVLQMPASTPESAKEMATNMRNFMSQQTAEQTRMYQKMYLPTMMTDPKRMDEVVEIAVKCDAPTIAQVMYEMFTIDLRQAVSTIDCPVLLLGSWIAYKTYGVTHESALESYMSQVAAIKNVKVEMTDTAKHFIFYDEPAWFYEKVDGFLKQL